MIHKKCGVYSVRALWFDGVRYLLWDTYEVVDEILRTLIQDVASFSQAGCGDHPLVIHRQTALTRRYQLRLHRITYSELSVNSIP